MNFQQIKNLKGFMPDHEGMALFKWAKKFSALGPILEIGTYCGKSSMYLSSGAKKMINMFLQLITTLVLRNIKLMRSTLMMRHMITIIKE